MSIELLNEFTKEQEITRILSVIAKAEKYLDTPDLNYIRAWAIANPEKTIDENNRDI